MAEKDIIQNMIRQLGQSQDERMPEELGIHFADLDERSRKELLFFAQKLAEFVNYYRSDTASAAGNWKNFFPVTAVTIDQFLNPQSAEVPPHLALLIAFLGLYKQPQRILNRFTGRHLDFYFQDVLRLKKKAAVPDKAYVFLELKKQSPAISISAENVFSAGKDNSGVELIYAPTGETVVNTSKVDSLRSLFVDNAGQGPVRYAPVANSADGVGGKLPESNPRWYGFGHGALTQENLDAGYAKLPAAEVGFAVASPVLRMKEGKRIVTVELTLSNVKATKLSAAALAGAFDVFVTGEKSWLGPYSVSLDLSGDVLKFQFEVPETEKAVIDYDAAIHGYAYTAQAPIVQVLLKAESTGIGYGDFAGITLLKARVSVNVSKVTSLTLEGDGGALNPKKAFVPFGAQPTKGSRFMVGCDEALGKKLTEVKLTLQWKGAPSSFSTHYKDYGESNIKNSDFTAAVALKDAGTWNKEYPGVALFESSNALAEHTCSFTPESSSPPSVVTTGMSIYALSMLGNQQALEAANTLVWRNPILTSFKAVLPEPQSGFITFALERDFLHATYRKKYMQNAMTYSKAGGTLVILEEPYTPTIQSISLSYQAHTDDVDIGSTDLHDFSNPDLQFFQIAYFGQRREHGYQRNQFSFLTDKRVTLLPAYDNEGELLIGFSNLKAGDSVSVLFQVAEGSADPEFDQEDITWSVLCDNYWKRLGSEGVVLDTTNQLLASGIIKFVIPAEATTQNTILPSGQLWLRAGLTRNVTAVCQLIEVAANAVEVQFTDQGNDLSHLATALEAGKIAKLKNGLSAVKSVKQKYASFDGKPGEASDAFYCRVAERLRHKDRCITPWDYERIILEAFPKVHKVKCIPHAKGDSWLAPGHVMIVVVPDLKNKNAMDPLAPKVDADTISRIQDFVIRHAGMWAQPPKVTVKNPRYQRIQLDFKAKFHNGYEFNFYSEQLKQQLTKFLSPWAFESNREISFGGVIYKSVLLDFVEELEPVDYVTDFRMYRYTEGSLKTDVNEAQPETPDAILVSDCKHLVMEAD